jgi:hypothetical protein
LPEDIPPIPILRNKRSGRGRPRSAEMQTCSPYKRKLEESIKKRKWFQPRKQETGNKEASKKVKRDYRSASVQADAIEDNRNQRMSFVHTARESSVMMRKVRYWVQCVMCEDWCHEECAGAYKDKFICDYCL